MPRTGKTTQTGFRLNRADEQILAAAQRMLGLTNRTEALRFILRQWAEQRQVKKKLSR